MHAAHAITAEELREFRPRYAKPARLREASALAQSLANVVRSGWSELSTEQREVFTALAYEAIDPPGGIRAVINRLRFARTVLLSDQESWMGYVASVRQLVDAILEAIEADNPAYEAELREASEALNVAAGKPPMNPNEFGEWLRGLSDPAE